MRTSHSALFILGIPSAALAFVAPQHRSNNIHRFTRTTINGENIRKNTFVIHALDDDNTTESSDSKEPSASPVSNRYDVSKLVGGDEGAGFNQFDPVLSTTGFLSRRFGILGGLAIFAGLALVEGREILKGLDDVTPLEGSGESITTASGLKITEVLVGKSGSTPLPGYIIGLRATVKIGDQVIYQTSAEEKPVAFKYGQRPFQNIICEGVEEGIKGMKVGGKRVLEVPANLAPPGVELPPGVPLTFEIELTEVLSGYF